VRVKGPRGRVLLILASTWGALSAQVKFSRSYSPGSAGSLVIQLLPPTNLLGSKTDLKYNSS